MGALYIMRARRRREFIAAAYESAALVGIVALIAVALCVRVPGF